MHISNTGLASYVRQIVALGRYTAMFVVSCHIFFASTFSIQILHMHSSISRANARSPICIGIEVMCEAR